MDTLLPDRRPALWPTAFAAVAVFAVSLVPVAPTLAAGAATEIAPHRAIYQMTLRSARNSSKIADVRGHMAFEWADACDAWTIEQRFQLRFVYAEGDEMNMTTNYVTWEAKNGLRYRFNVRKLVNGDLDEEVRGEARLDKAGAGGTAQFVQPEVTETALPPGTMFPTAHTLGIIRQARSGNVLFPRVVFDGADAEGLTEINAVIANPVPVKPPVESPLLTGKTAWPVRMAFFPLDGTAPLPEYEMSIHLLASGVVASMQIDYGDFVVDAVLKSIEPLPKSGC